jgi:hypothetical protein
MSLPDPVRVVLYHVRAWPATAGSDAAENPEPQLISVDPAWYESPLGSVTLASTEYAGADVDVFVSVSVKVVPETQAPIEEGERDAEAETDTTRVPVTDAVAYDVERQSGGAEEMPSGPQAQ